MLTFSARFCFLEVLFFLFFDFTRLAAEMCDIYVPQKYPFWAARFQVAGANSPNPIKTRKVAKTLKKGENPTPRPFL